jgi:hypothetical protein
MSQSDMASSWAKQQGKLATAQPPSAKVDRIVRVIAIRQLHGRRHHRAGMQIHRVSGVIGQERPTDRSSSAAQKS